MHSVLFEVVMSEISAEVLAGLLICAAMYGLERRCKRGMYRAVCAAAMVVWLAAVLYLTTLSRVPIFEVRYSLRLFDHYTLPDWYGFVQNAVLFLPAGFVACCLFERLPKWKTALIGAGLSLGIELAQLITHRGICDINDLTANVCGWCMGVFLWMPLNKAFGSRKSAE